MEMEPKENEEGEWDADVLCPSRGKWKNKGGKGRKWGGGGRGDSGRSTMKYPFFTVPFSPSSGGRRYSPQFPS